MAIALYTEIENAINEAITDARAKGISTDCLAFAYARVSTSKQAERGNSKEDQESDAEEYASRAGLYIIHLFSAAESAYSEGRVNFNLMLNLADRFGIPNVIFKNTDRLSRNDIDWPRCKKLARDGRLRIHLYELNIVFQMNSTAEEEMFLDNTSVMAKYWSNKISQGVNRGYKSKALKRRVAHKMPIGYKWNAHTGNWEIDPETEPVVRELFDLYDIEKRTMDDIAAILNAKGCRTFYDKPFYKQIISNILKNEVYSGWFSFHGERIKGAHPAYISEERFSERMFQMKGNFRGHRVGSTHYLFAKFVKCPDCGHVFTGYKKGKEFAYYIHRCTALGGIGKTLKEIDLLAMIDAQVGLLLYSESYTEFLHTKFRNMIRNRDTGVQKDRGVIDRRMKELESERDVLLDLYLKKKIDLARFESKEAEIINQIAVLHDRQKLLSDDLSQHYHTVAELIDYLRNFSNLFLRIPPEGKVEFLREMAYGIETDCSSIRILWKPLYSHLLNAKVAGAISPATEVVSPNMHARQDSNL